MRRTAIAARREGQDESVREAARARGAALSSGLTHVGEDWRALLAHPKVEIIVEATGNPIAAVEHALAAFDNGKHVVMVTVEADAMCGPLPAALNFVIDDVLEGGVNGSLNLDGHGKTNSFRLLVTLFRTGDRPANPRSYRGTCDMAVRNNDRDSAVHA